jgi:hypothetical protein
MTKNQILIAVAVLILLVVVFVAFNAEDTGNLNYEAPKSLIDSN